MIVHKFGGTSLADASCFRRVGEIIASRPERNRAVVVSAMSGVTNSLVRAVKLAGERDVAGYEQTLAELGEKHRRTLVDLAPGRLAAEFEKMIEQDRADIADVLRATTLLRRSSRETLDLVSGYGELWSARLLHALFNATGAPSTMIDARDVLIA